jgi:hypothetical protein
MFISATFIFVNGDWLKRKEGIGVGVELGGGNNKILLKKRFLYATDIT